MTGPEEWERAAEPAALADAAPPAWRPLDAAPPARADASSGPRAPGGIDTPADGAVDGAVEVLRLLVVDDDAVDRLAVRRALRGGGVSAACDDADSAEAARAALDAAAYDCVLLDYNLPGSDGLALLHELRARGVSTPVVMLTGQGDEQVAVALMKAGAADYLPKAALTPERLGKSVRYAVDLARAAEATRRAEAERRASTERTARLQTVTAQLATALATDDVARLFVSEVRAAIGADAAWIGVLDDAPTDGPRVLRALASTGYDEKTTRLFATVPLDAPVPVTAVARDARPRYYASRAALVAAWPALVDAQLTGDQEAVAVLPLAVGDAPFGVMAVGFHAVRDLAEEDRAFVLALARQCAQALERARLYEAERRLRDAAEAARRDAEEANRAKSEFLARMSHDLRTPLNAIGGYAQLIALGVHGPVTDAQQAALGRVQRAQAHLLTLINDILSFAKLEAGQVQVTLDVVPVAPVLHELAALVEPAAAARGLAVTVDVAPCDDAPRDDAPRDDVRRDDAAHDDTSRDDTSHDDTSHDDTSHDDTSRDDTSRDEAARAAAGEAAVQVVADRERLLQILLNLTSNALKFTPAGGLHLALECPGADVVALHVRDTGLGIPADRLDAIFAPFVQARGTVAERAEGVGLGLAISRELARMMGGDLTVASTEGIGSTFTVRLQRAHAAGDAPRADAPLR